MVFKQLRKALKPGGPGFVVLHETQLDLVPEGLIDGIGGLVALQPFRGPGGKLNFIAFWSSSDQHAMGRPTLEARLQPAVAAAAGVAAAPITKPAGLIGWVKDNGVAIVLTTAAVLTALDVLSDRYDGLIAAPQFTARLDKHQHDIDEGDTLSASLAIENAMSAVALTDIRITPTLKATRGGTPAAKVELRDPQGTALPATRSRTFALLGSGLAPGEYDLGVVVLATAGTLRDPVEQIASSSIVVWPQAPRVDIALKKISGNRADFTWALSVGGAEPGEVLCDLVIEGQALAKSTNYWRPMDPRSTAQWLESDADRSNGETPVVRLRAVWPAVKPRSVQLAEFSLTGDPGTDWKKVLSPPPTCSLVRK